MAEASSPTFHIIGAGLAGLSAALELARQGRRVTLYEQAAHAGGRCRSFHDARIDRLIDNGNHLLLTANRNALAYIDEVGSADAFVGPANPSFPFLDLRSGRRWSVQPGPGRRPWWILDDRRRVPGSRWYHYLEGLRLARAGPDARVGDCLSRTGPLWETFWRPLCVAALNTQAEEADARLLWVVLRDTFARGAEGCRPLIARDGLGPALVDPAVRLVEARGGAFRFVARLKGLAFADGRVSELRFPGHSQALGKHDAVICAVPPANAGSLVPGLAVPRESRAIVNAHLRLDAPLLPQGPPILGLIGGTAEWLFLRGDVASLTVSAADHLADVGNEDLAERFRRETAVALGLPSDCRPAIRIIREKRATFAQTPEDCRLRAPARTRWANLFMAGDWTRTGYPATIESAIRSGRTAAAAALGSIARE